MASAQHQRLVYMDHAAATPVAREVREAMEPFLSEEFYNPSAPYAPARATKAKLEEARQRLGHVLGSRGGNITLAAGATEANNLAFATVDGQVLTDAIEHESVLACAQARDAVIVSVDKTGLVDPELVRASLKPTTELVSIELANGEIGTIQPIRQIAQIVAAERMRRLEAKENRPLLLHTDASQAAGHVSLNVSTLGVDLLTLSAAKIYGPKQVGLLWHADGVALRPLLRGGGQEGGVRSGTENVAGAVGFAKALEIAEDMRPGETKRLRSLARRLRQGIVQGVGEVVLSGASRDKGRLPGLVHASIMGVDARRLVIGLERKGVLVGTGSACAASRMRVSHVLQAIGLPDEFARGSLRFTMGRTTSSEEVDYTVEALVSCVKEERRRTGR